MATLQKQGVPVPDHLTGPQAGPVVGAPGAPRAPSRRGNGPQSRTASPSKSSRGSAPRRSASTARKSVSNRQSGTSNGPEPDSSGNIPNPVSAGTDAATGVGLLEAEFLTALMLLILLLFSDTSSSMTDKMMSAMKRGSLICAVFFILALVAGIGPNAAKSAKAFGALVIVATLVTTPMSTVLTDLDGLIKNDWIGAVPQTGSDTGKSGTTPTSGSTADDILGDVVGAAETAINPAGHVLKPLLSKIGINIP